MIEFPCTYSNTLRLVSRPYLLEGLLKDHSSNRISSHPKYRYDDSMHTDCFTDLKVRNCTYPFVVRWHLMHLVEVWGYGLEGLTYDSRRLSMDDSKPKRWQHKVNFVNIEHYDVDLGNEEPLVVSGSKVVNVLCHLATFHEVPVDGYVAVVVEIDFIVNSRRERRARPRGPDSMTQVDKIDIMDSLSYMHSLLAKCPGQHVRGLSSLMNKLR